jgi:hypothetical protein
LFIIGFSQKVLGYRPPEESMMWTVYRPPGGREPHSFVDSLHLIIDCFEESAASQKRKYVQLLLVGDSLTDLTYFGFLCSGQRTLGARIVELKVVS